MGAEEALPLALAHDAEALAVAAPLALTHDAEALAVAAPLALTHDAEALAVVTPLALPHDPLPLALAVPQPLAVPLGVPLPLLAAEGESEPLAEREPVTVAVPLGESEEAGDALAKALADCERDTVALPVGALLPDCERDTVALNDAHEEAEAVGVDAGDAVTLPLAVLQVVTVPLTLGVEDPHSVGVAEPDAEQEVAPHSCAARGGSKKAKSRNASSISPLKSNTFFAD